MESDRRIRCGDPVYGVCLMPWLAIKLFMGGALKRIGGMFASFFAWAKRNPAWAILLIVSLVGGFYTWRLSSKLEHTKHRLAVTQKAFADTIVNYRLAAIAFEKKQTDNLVRVADEYKENADEQIAAYSADADNYRARFERLRNERRQGRASQVAMPAVPDATGSPTQPDNNSPDLADSEMIAVRIDDLEVLVNGALQGRAIQELWLANEAVDTDGE